VHGVDFFAAVALALSGQPVGLTSSPPRAPAPAADRVARLVEPALLRASPNGRVVARLGLRTSFGSRRRFPVVERRGNWVGVVAAERSNGKLGWLPAWRVRTHRARVRVYLDLSERTLRAKRGGRTVLRMKVAVGAPATPTPTGQFAVTDRLPGFGPYGCCILALSARQPHLADSWSGGDRIAIHGTDMTSSIGAAVSNGCVRAPTRSLRRLVALVRPGVRVLIRR
jgi:lipoprotein-anchoring transpeptidase ErfK/SrfK